MSNTPLDPVRRTPSEADILRVDRFDDRVVGLVVAADAVVVVVL